MFVIQRIRDRLAVGEGVGGDSGFTLIELLIVLEIIAIILAIATPSILSFRIRANKRAASSDVRVAIPTAETYYLDPTKGNLTYKNMTLPALQAIDGTTKLDAVVVSTDFSTYCLHMTVGGRQSLVVRGTRATNAGLVQEDVASACPVSAAL